MANRTRVVLLVAGNDQGDLPIALALEGDGAANYTYVTAPTISAARAFCGMASPDVLVLEERLPDGEGLALLGELVGAHSELAFAAILLLEAENQALVAQARRLGAYDCLVNGHGLPDYLGRSIAGALAQLELRRENA